MITNFDLEERAKEINIPLVGVFSKDRLPPIRRPGGYIINLQDSIDEAGNPLPGTHWTSFYIEDGPCGKLGCNPRRRVAVYFDSFGVIAPQSVQEFLRPFRPWMYSEKHIQNIRSEICGYYALYFIWFMHRHRFKIKDINKRFQTFLRLFSNDPEKNKKLLEKYIRPL